MMPETLMLSNWFQSKSQVEGMMSRKKTNVKSITITVRKVTKFNWALRVFIENIEAIS